VVLVDTSVWIEVFRRGSTFRLESAVELDEVVTCLPVVQEVLQGFDDERAYRIAHDSMFAFPMVESPLTDRVFVEAVELYRRARRAGKTVRSGVDCLIAACAIRHGLTILHNDRDFAELAQISRLQHRPISRGQAVKRAKGSGRES
jgi:predicted nucleic acid-binding protein